MNIHKAGRMAALAATSALLAVAGLGPLAAQPVTIPAGDDGWVTVGSGQTKVDLGQYPLSTVFTSCGTYTPPVVSLKSSPLNSSQLGSIDTIVSRAGGITLPTLGSRVTGTVQIEAISMVSETSFMLGTCGPFNLNVYDSSFGSSQGTITVTLSTADGGTFDSTFNVVPKLIFTPVRGGAKQTIDCGSVPHGGKCSGGFTLSTSGAEWARSSGNSGGFDASSAGVTPIAANIGVSGDGSGTTTYTTKGNAGNNFYTGFSHISPFPPKPSQHNHEVAVNFFHQSQAALDCKPGPPAPAAPASPSAAEREVETQQLKSFCISKQFF